MTYIKIQWLIVVFVFFIDIVWINISSLSLLYSDFFFIKVIFIWFLLYAVYLFYKNFRPDPRITTALLSTLCFLMFTGAMEILCYLFYTTNQPLVNQTLANIDGYFGFHAPDLVLWFQSHKWWDVVFYYIYMSGMPQILLTFLYFSFLGNPIILQRFIMQFMLAAFPTIIIGALWPALSTHEWYHFASDIGQVSAMERLHELRQGILNLTQADGIITFPSFHTTIGVFIIYAFLNERKLIFIPVLLLNILMIFSCLSHGSHFLIDIIGGLFIAVVTIKLEGLLFRYVNIPSLKKINHREAEASKSLKNPSSV